ncbi:MAG TPA: hypothetical protein VLJ86_22070 [Ramlibacter sp.]|nr:hypothetical protein [Ramlibacter sp.]
MNYKRLGTAGALIGSCLVSGCAVYPYYPAGGQVYAQPQYQYGDPNTVYAQPAPVMVAPAPVYYGPAYPAIYPSISIFGRFGGGRDHWRGGRDGRHWRGR